MTARPCVCGKPGRPYLTGVACDDHAPWALAGRENPDVVAARARATWPEEWVTRAARPLPKPAARRTDPGTSHAAAATVRGVTETREHILEVLAYLDQGATDEQIAEVYDQRVRAGAWRPVSPSGLRTRRAELVDLGMVRDSGRTRLTESGRRSVVWARVA